VRAPLFDAQERLLLCDLLDELGPHAPTLLDPWTTYDLAAHLVVREHDLVAAPGLVIPGAWGRFAAQRQRALQQTAFKDLVAAVRSGPRGFFRIGWVRRFPNLNEYFVHHEDVRRANGLGARTLTNDLEGALWNNVRRGRRFLSRRVRGVGLEIAWAATGERLAVRRPGPTARLRGTPGELLLYLFGRQAAAQVEVSGSDEAVAAVRRTHFGM